MSGTFAQGAASTSKQDCTDDHGYALQNEEDSDDATEK